MKKLVTILVAVLLLIPTLGAFGSPGTDDKKQEQTKKPDDTRRVGQPLAFGLEDGTPIKLRLTRNLSSADAKTGDRVDFEVLEDVKVKDVIVVPRGGIAWATVTEAEHKKRMARGGKLNVNIDDVRLADGEKAPLRAVKESKGGGHTGAMTGAMVGTAIVFFPAAPLFLFMHGKDITIPKGTEITAYINGDIPLDPARFAAQAPAPAPTSAPDSKTVPASAPAPDPVITTKARVIITSTPPGADIEVDGSFMGNTPSTVELPSGEHTIKIKKSGFWTWDRKVKLTTGEIKIDAVLESRGKWGSQ